MQILNVDALPLKQKTAVVLGCFDGVHKGHQKLIQACVAESTNALVPVMFTFKENPVKNLKEKISSAQIISQKQKLEISKKMGIKYLYQSNFADVRNFSAKEFVEHILKNNLNAQKVFCGFNFRFAKEASANSKDLLSLCDKVGIEVKILDAICYENEIISSTLIRKYLACGNIKKVNELLARPYSIDFIVESGNKLGRTIGIPTINQRYPDGFQLPCFGVYASFVELGGKLYHSLTNIGLKPTVGSEYPLAETWVPEHDLGNLYGHSVKVNLIDFIRPEKKFKNLDELCTAVFDDAKKAREIVERYNFLSN